MRSICISFFCVLSFSVFSQNNNDLPERKGFTLIIPVDKTHEYADSIKPTPYIVHADIIQIYPGESVNVEIELTDTGIKSMKTVSEIKYPDKTISISLRQLAEQHVHKSMMLEINNPFKKDLTYAVRMFLMRSKAWVDTDVLPVKAGLAAYESWPDVIVSMALYDWKFKDN